MLAIELDGLQILGAPYFGGARGLFVKRDGLKGWDDLPSGRRDAVALPQAHGEFDLPVFRGPRLVTVEGYILASSAFDLGELRSQLLGVGADGQAVQVRVDHQEQTLSASGRVISASVVDTANRGQRVRASFAIDLVCADPRKYGAANIVEGKTVQASHLGNFPASPLIEVTGPITAPYTVTGPSGRSITVSQALAAGQTHRLNLATGEISRNDTRQFGALTVYQPWTVPARRMVSMTISTGVMKATTQDTYM